MIAEQTLPSGRPTRRVGLRRRYSCVAAPIWGEGLATNYAAKRAGAVGYLERSYSHRPSAYPMLLLAAATAAARCSANNTDAPKTTFTSEYHIWVLTRIPDVLEAPVPLVLRSKASKTQDSQSQPFRASRSFTNPRTP